MADVQSTRSETIKLIARLSAFQATQPMWGVHFQRYSRRTDSTRTKTTWGGKSASQQRPRVQHTVSSRLIRNSSRLRTVTMAAVYWNEFTLTIREVWHLHAR